MFAPPSPLPAVPEDAVLDALWQGRLPLWQPARKKGYRFNLDSVLLAGFVQSLAPAPSAPSLGGHLVDLGAGCGVIGLSLLAERRAQQLTAVERQPQLAQLIRRNVALYGWQRRVQVVAGDLRAHAWAPADWVVFNPPYFAQAAGRAGKEPGRDAGRRECHGTLTDFVQAAGRTLAPTGTLAAIVPYLRRHELLQALAAAGLHAAVERRVLPFAGRPPGHLLLAARRPAAHPRACTRAPCLVVHAPGGGYLPEVAALIRGPAAWRGPPDGAGGAPPSVA